MGILTGAFQKFIRKHKFGVGMLIWEYKILRHHASIVREYTDAGLSYKSNAMAEYLAMMI